MFDKRFEVFLADTQKAKELHYRLRYEVYCLERGWEDPGEFPDQMEMDEYDDNSVHFLVRERATGQWIAGLRLVLGSFKDLPVAQACDEGEALNVVPAEVLQQTAAEFSRLHILPEHRNGKVNSKSADKKPAPGAGPGRASEVMLGMIRAARDYSDRHGIDSWYFITTRALGRVLQGIGLDLKAMDSAVEHHGIRQPFYGDLDVFFDPMAEKNPAAHAMFEKTKISEVPGYRLFSEIENQALVANGTSARRYAHG